jgi:lipoic acid synthetase
MILGDTCTRACGYCNVKSGTPNLIDKEEPKKVAKAVREMGLRYAVVTSVTRDDLADGGAAIFAETIRAIRKANPLCKVEVLIPDFGADSERKALRKVLAARPDVLAHNIEVVKRLFGKARPKGDYARSLRLLKSVKSIKPNILTKSGFMVGLGETEEEIIRTMKDLRKSGCDLLTIGQYLQPTRRHLPVVKYYHPDEFVKLKKTGEAMGFLHVESGPLVRSSYMAERYSRSGIRNRR